MAAPCLYDPAFFGQWIIDPVTVASPAPETSIEDVATRSAVRTRRGITASGFYFVDPQLPAGLGNTRHARDAHGTDSSSSGATRSSDEMWETLTPTYWTSVPPQTDDHTQHCLALCWPVTLTENLTQQKPVSCTAVMTIVRLKPRKALPFFCRHPWVFAGAIDKVHGNPRTGDEVRLVTAEGEFIARGLYNAASKIQVRLYRWEDAPLDRDYWRTRLERALALRQQLFGDTSAARNACRLVFSEGDGLSGLTVDRYGDWLLTQWTSAALWTRRDELLDLLNELVRPRGIWQRTEKGMGELEQLEASDGLASGEPPPNPIIITENGVEYAVDVVAGQKTGFYFDQRENRQVLSRFTRDARVLDICTYTGSFGLNALKNGRAKSVLAVDSSRNSLELAMQNAERNGVADRFQTEVADAFDKLEELAAAKQEFYVVILDPPKLARTQSGLKRAMKAYVRMNRLGMQVVRPGGLLMTCSCSGLVSRSEFEQVLVQSAQQAGREVQILDERGQAPDHPVSAHCLETNYLKCFLCRIS